METQRIRIPLEPRPQAGDPGAGPGTGDPGELAEARELARRERDHAEAVQALLDTFKTEDLVNTGGE